jgi:4-amino-4-deoxy-L-arabinose transferase-like glycosyltransferase
MPTVALIVWVAVRWRFGGLYGQDAYAYYEYGTQTLPHFLLHGTPLTAFFWPLGYPALIAVSTLLFGSSAAAAQGASVAAGVGAVVLTYLLGRDLLTLSGASENLALRSAATGAILFGVTGWAVRSSVTIMSDSLAVATSLLAIWAVVRWCKASGDRSGRAITRECLWLGLAAAALAWSIVTRWGQMALIPVAALGALPALAGNTSRFLRASVWAAGVAAIIIGTQVLLMVTVKPGLDLGPVPFGGDLSLVNGGGWSAAHVFQRVFVNADGIQRYTLSNGAFYASTPFRSGFLTPLFIPLVLLGAWIAAANYGRAALVLIAWPAVLLTLDAGLPEQSARFVLAVLPPLAILAGLGSMTLIDWLAGIWKSIAVLVVCAGILAVAVTGTKTVDTLAVANASDLAVANWAGRLMPAQAQAIAFGITLTLTHTSHLRTVDLSVLTSGQLRAITRRPTYVLVQPWAMTGEWAHLVPGANFRYLQHNIGLVKVGSLHGYTLYKAGRQ